jgi:predicted transposase/invertase (TIGR01784 family)
MTHTPHNALFRAVYGQAEHARGALRAVVPPALAAALDWSSLTRQPGSFVDPVFTERHTDLLYSVAWHGGGHAFVYLLFEHQSTPDPLMAFRLLRYQLHIWDQWSAAHPDEHVLPTIIPIVLYHGDKPWAAPRSFDALLDAPDHIRPAIDAYLVRFAYLLDDLSEISDEALRARVMTALSTLAAMCFKHARSGPDLLQRLCEWADLMREVLQPASGLEALALVMRYILLVNDQVEPETLQELLEHHVSPQAKDAVMTAGEKMIQQGIQQGEARVLLRLLRRRFGDAVTADTEQRVAAAPAEQIETWSERVLSAATLAELLAD